MNEQRTRINNPEYRRLITVNSLRNTLLREELTFKMDDSIEILFSTKDQDEIKKLLDKIKNIRSYYIGGSLCIDCIINSKKDVLILNLDETYGLFSGGMRGLLSIENSIELFDRYKEQKGETAYFKEMMGKASIRHIYDLRTRLKPEPEKPILKTPQTQLYFD